jgi:hypothetical protein
MSKYDTIRPSCNCPNPDPVICTMVKVEGVSATMIDALGAKCTCQCHYANPGLLPGVLIDSESWQRNKIVSHKRYAEIKKVRGAT